MESFKIFVGANLFKNYDAYWNLVRRQDPEFRAAEIRNRELLFQGLERAIAEEANKLKMLEPPKKRKSDFNSQPRPEYPFKRSKTQKPLEIQMMKNNRFAGACHCHRHLSSGNKRVKRKIESENYDGENYENHVAHHSHTRKRNREDIVGYRVLSNGANIYNSIQGAWGR